MLTAERRAELKQKMENNRRASAVRAFRRASLRWFGKRYVETHPWPFTVRSVQGAATSNQIGALSAKMEAPVIRKEKRADARLRKQRIQEAQILGTIREWEGGLRGEEIAAATGLPEEQVWKLLASLKERGLVEDKGDRGWFNL